MLSHHIERCARTLTEDLPDADDPEDPEEDQRNFISQPGPYDSFYIFNRIFFHNCASGYCAECLFLEDFYHSSMNKAV